MKIKVRVKTLEEIKECSVNDRYLNYCVYGSTFVLNLLMKKYCGKVIKLKKWDGEKGYFEGWWWTAPMFSEIDVKEYNRNGANS